MKNTKTNAKSETRSIKLSAKLLKAGGVALAMLPMFFLMIRQHNETLVRDRK